MANTKQKPTRYKMHVKKGDTVERVLPKTSQVIVAGVNVRTKHVKPRQEGESGQIATFEAPIHSSNVMLYSEKEKTVSRVCYTFTEDGRKVRMLKKTGEIID